MVPMEVKNMADLFRALDGENLDRPPVLLVSGVDPSVFDLALDRVRTRIRKDVGSCETTVYSGEPGDEERFLVDLFNIPLFSPYRLFVVRRGQEILKGLTATPKTTERYRHDFSKMPDSTWILIQVDGKPSAGLLKIFQDRIIHFQTRELYSRDIIKTIESMERKFHLHLEEEAIFELKERVEPRTGAIEQALARLKELLPAEREGRVTREDIRELLFPSPGLNPFRLVDGLFELNHGTVRRELKRWNGLTDNYFVILKLILNRVDEIRKASIALSHGSSDRELTELLGHAGKPPFVQKKIQERLHEEILRFEPDHQGRIYNFLISLQKDFRTGAGNARQQHILFQERLLRVFFEDPGEVIEFPDE